MIRGIAVLTLGVIAGSCLADWKPTSAPLMTRWVKDVKQDKPWDVYPRPQFQRDAWMNLNGMWDVALRERALGDAPVFDRKILVPYPVEAPLSGVGERAAHVAYRREFTVPKVWGEDQRILLHFDAVDWQTSVSLNGERLVTLDGDEVHRGGYDRFSFDVTDVVSTGTNVLLVSVFDPSDEGEQPRGKQVTESHGIWYTPTTGIWQTVWLEPVSRRGHLRRVKFTPNAAEGTLNVKTEVLNAAEGAQVEIWLGEDEPLLTVAPNEEADVKLSNPRLWNPDDPHLYGVEARLRVGDDVVDSVKTYFALRDIEVRKIGDFNRILLNGKEIFQLGLLDQGFWPEGNYTAPTPEALLWDVDFALELGFNMIRKHIKVEPDIWYHYCDTRGVLVWQDAVNGGIKSDEGRKYFESDLFRMIENHWNSPSIVLWVVFNEGWGQYDTERLTEEVKKRDPSRLVTNASGWVDKNVGDVLDMHKYPGPGVPDPDAKRASVLGEFGGLGYFVDGHSWGGKLWGYQGTGSREESWARWSDVMAGLRYLRAAHGLCAAVYTQTTDVEIEANGLVTYDREVEKLDSGKVRELTQSILNTGGVSVLAETALAEEPPQWQFTMEKPGDDWATTMTESGDWQTSAAGFGRLSDRLFGKIGTRWESKEIWIRRVVEIPEGIDTANLKLIGNFADSADFYINGVKGAERSHYVTGYTPIPLSEDAQRAVRPGKNVLAIYARRDDGDVGQYVDAGLLLVTGR